MPNRWLYVPIRLAATTPQTPNFPLRFVLFHIPHKKGRNFPEVSRGNAALNVGPAY